jgi:hypothetical protein
MAYVSINIGAALFVFAIFCFTRFSVFSNHKKNRRCCSVVGQSYVFLSLPLFYECIKRSTKIQIIYR